MQQLRFRFLLYFSFFLTRLTFLIVSLERVRETFSLSCYLNVNSTRLDWLVQITLKDLTELSLFFSSYFIIFPVQLLDSEQPFKRRLLSPVTACRHTKAFRKSPSSLLFLLLNAILCIRRSDTHTKGGWIVEGNGEWCLLSDRQTGALVMACLSVCKPLHALQRVIDDRPMVAANNSVPLPYARSINPPQLTCLKSSLAALSCPIFFSLSGAVALEGMR